MTYQKDGEIKNWNCFGVKKIKIAITTYYKKQPELSQIILFKSCSEKWQKKRTSCFNYNKKKKTTIYNNSKILYPILSYP